MLAIDNLLSSGGMQPHTPKHLDSKVLYRKIQVIHMSRYKKTEIGIYGIFLYEECLYIGRGFLQDRQHYHWSRCRNQKHKNIGLQEYWNENDGENNLEFRVLENCTKLEYKEREQFYIDSLKPKFNKLRASNYKYNFNTYRKLKIRKHRSEINSRERNPRALYTNEQIKQVKRFIADGYGNQEICDMTGVSYGNLMSVKSGNRWRNITIEDNVIL